jgi:hypothetical protein
MVPPPCSACKRADGFCCAEARDLFKRLQAYFLLGVATGDWGKFDETRTRFEDHYQGHEEEPPKS